MKVILERAFAYLMNDAVSLKMRGQNDRLSNFFDARPPPHLRNTF
jgi:hypothetical protein